MKHIPNLFKEHLHFQVLSSFKDHGVLCKNTLQHSFLELLHYEPG